MIKKLLERYSPLRYLISSGIAWVVDNGLYYALLHFIFAPIESMSAVTSSTAAQIIARVVSSFLNFLCNRCFVFHSDENFYRSMYKYYCLCVPQALVSVLLLDVAIKSLTINSEFIQLLIKVVIEAVLCVISYLIQNKWVFRKKK